MADQLDRRAYSELSGALALAQNTVYKAYLDVLDQYPLVAPDPLLLDESPQRCLRMFHLKQLTCKKGEDIFQKLSTVYHAAMSIGSSLFVLLDAPGADVPVNIYLGVHVPDTLGKKQASVRRTSYNALTEGILSHFPGSIQEDVSVSEEIPGLVEDIFGSHAAHISAVSCVASIRDKEKTEQKAFIQGLEKLIDVMHGKSYTALFIADPVTPEQQREIRSGYESLYSTFSAFQKSVWSYQENESHAVMESLSHGLSESTIESVSHTQSHTISQTKGSSDTVGIGIQIGGNRSSTDSTTMTHAETAPSKALRAGRVIGVAGSLVSLIPGPGCVVGPILRTAGGVVSKIHEGESITDSIANTVGKAFGVNIGGGVNYGHGWNRSESTSDGTSDTDMQGKQKGTTETETSGTTDTKGTGRTLQIENVNKSITELLQRIDEQLKRAREAEDYGAYSCGAYFLSSREEDCLLAANTYRALMLGEGSSVERGAVHVWNDPEIVDGMKDYLRHFAQPVFAMPLRAGEGENAYMVQMPGTIVSGLELPLHMGLPTCSVMGLPVIAHAEFGRNAVCGEDAIRLGMLCHMGQATASSPVGLDRQHLASHTFITGSTGSGKSNAIYQILGRASEKGIGFLVIEPAKGEYKQVFGKSRDVSVYGTDPLTMPLLKIDPFRFPKGIHVFEHLDRLVEVFNACWPMYAAMPAVLKGAIEKAYADSGWDLAMSENRYGDGLFPTFRDVFRNVREIINQSEYDAENKGAYKGALLTRLQSLQSGVNGLVFSKDEIPAEKLFDGRAIVDLSRVGSMETKSLLMGMLVLKLQEYRMADAAGMNAPLRHLTVLEEAHNLLKRTSTEQPTEGGNLLGKSVEMLSNAIAEMRSYGEGFIIADQAPGLLDMASIRNTNTKLILRLPDQGDRELVGRAANLNDEQIAELAKLPCGTAAVYQNEWVEPILCQIDKYEEAEAPGVYTKEETPEDAKAPAGKTAGDAKKKDVMDDALFLATLLSKGLTLSQEHILRDIRPRMDRIAQDTPTLNDVTRERIERMLACPLELDTREHMKGLASVMTALFPAAFRALGESHLASPDKRDWTRAVVESLEESHAGRAEGLEPQVWCDIIQALFIAYFPEEHRRDFVVPSEALKDWEGWFSKDWKQWFSGDWRRWYGKEGDGGHRVI